MCSFEKLTDDAEKFIKDAGIKKYGCLRFENGAYVMDETKCGGLDEWFTVFRSINCLKIDCRRKNNVLNEIKSRQLNSTSYPKLF